MLKKLAFWCGVLLFVEGAWAQYPQPQMGWLYSDQSVPRVDVLIDQDSLNFILDPANSQSNHEFPATFIFTRNGQSDTVDNIGFRLRGNTSRGAPKQSFKVSVNSFTPGKRYKGVKKINLNGENNDPSVSRARLCWEWGRANGLPVSRVCHTEFYINGNYRGIYINLEHINDDWLTHRFGNNSGNLYKCLWPANLEYISNNQNDYKFTRGDGKRAYDLKTNEDQDDYSDLVNLISVINNTPLNQLECELDKIFNIEGYVKVLAMEVASGHWDSYSYLQNNYYLYNDPLTGKFHYIPYDMDNTLGIDWIGRDWGTRDINNWTSGGLYLPLTERLMQLPQVKEMYKFYLRQITQFMAQPGIIQQIDSVKNQIDTYALNDPFRPLGFGFTYNDFLDSFTGNQSMGHVDYSIGDFLSTRILNTNIQLGAFNAAPIIHSIEALPTTQAGQLQIIATVEDEATPTVSLEYSIDGGTLQTVTMSDNGQDDDGIAGNRIYGARINSIADGSTVQYQVTAIDPPQNTRARPCSPANFVMPVAAELVINEFMADNNNTLTDEDGDASDWIELYNNSSTTISLDNYYLTDDLADPTKWKLPNATMAPGEFRLIWASGKSNVHAWHTNFGLSKNGEEIGLFKDNSGQMEMVDDIIYGPQQEDVSYGRSYDASPVWISFISPTPNASNGPLSVEEEVTVNPVLIGPNPFNEVLYLNNKGDEDWTWMIVDLQGREIQSGVLEENSRDQLVLQANKGLYFIRLSNGSQTFIEKLIKD